MERKSHIGKYWDGQAKKHGTSPSASWEDGYAIALEIDLISKHIIDGDVVLDVGCANGHATIEQDSRHDIEITGVDFSESMIREAKKISDINFKVGDVRKLMFDDATFDVVYTTRTLINLPTWEEQRIGIEECLRVCKSGGRVLFLEAFWDPFVRLNALRTVCGLPPLEEPEFNNYLKEYKIMDFFLKNHSRLRYTVSIVDFSSLYYLGSRFIRDLTYKWGGTVGYRNPINKGFFHLEKNFPGVEGFGVQRAVVVKKNPYLRFK